MLLFNWDECQKGNLRFVNRDARSRWHDPERFEALFDQYLQRFGFSDQTQLLLETKQLLAKLRLAYVQTSDRMLLNQIAIEEKNLQLYDPSKHKGMTTDEALAFILLQTGARLDKKVISVVEFRTTLDQFKKINKA